MSDETKKTADEAAGPTEGQPEAGGARPTGKGKGKGKGKGSAEAAPPPAEDVDAGGSQDEAQRIDPRELKAQKMAKKAEAQQKAGKGGKKDKKGKKSEAEKFVARSKPPRLKRLYQDEIVPALMKEFSYTTPMAVPRLVKITINMGLGEALQNAKLLDSAEEELAAITGQKPVITKARKSIATYKLRQGQKIGAMVTLRRERMYEFLDRLVTFALPRTRDFRGISPRSFDGRGNFSLGIREQIIFSEIDYDKIEKIKGLNVTIVTTARTDEEGRALLKHMGMPFR